MHFRSTLLLAVSVLLSACTKEPGIGGKALLKGTVMRQDVNIVGIPQGSPYPYQDTRVFIIYGDNDFYDDDVRTGPNGNFEFRWLRKGKYTVYTYGECNCPGKSVQVSAEVSIGGNKDVVTVPVFTVNNF